MKTRLLLIFSLFLTFSCIYAQKKAFTLADLYRIKTVGGPILSPDGKTFAYTVTTSNLEKGKTNSDIYLMNVDGSGNKALVNSDAQENNPLWDKEGKGIYYISTKTGTSQLFYIKTDGSGEKQITEFYSGVSDPVLSPDGKTIAFTSQVFPECGTDQDCNKKNSESMEKGPIQAHMADNLLFRHWTEYADGKFTHIFTYNQDDKTYTDITPGNWESPTFQLGGGVGFNFSPDGKEICFMSKRVKDPASSTNADLWMVRLDNPKKEAENITSANQSWDGNPVYSPDGRYIAYRNQVIPRYESDRFRISIFDRQTKKSKIITEKFDNWINDFIWGENSKEIYFTADVRGYSPIYKVNLESEKIEKISSDESISEFTLLNQGKGILYNKRSVAIPSEIYTMDFASKIISQLTKTNEDFLNEVDVRPAEQIWAPGADGKKVQVFIVKPHNFDPNKKYPLILNVHGGPQS
ncbi:MAG: S9 family peptidase [Clostridiales bacterium]